MKIKKDKDKFEIVRVSLDMPYEVYRQMKEKTLIRNCTTRFYILQALLEKIAQEESYT